MLILDQLVGWAGVDQAQKIFTLVTFFFEREMKCTPSAGEGRVACFNYHYALLSGAPFQSNGQNFCRHSSVGRAADL